MRQITFDKDEWVLVHPKTVTQALKQKNVLIKQKNGKLTIKKNYYATQNY